MKILANPKVGFKFSGWTGDIQSVSHELEIEVHRDIQTEAVFLPDVSGEYRLIHRLDLLLNMLTP